MVAWLSRKGKDYDWSIVPEQLGLKERERGQHLVRGAHRWSLWMGSGGTWPGISDGLVDDSQALSIPYTYSESWGLSLWCSFQVMLTDAGNRKWKSLLPLTACCMLTYDCFISKPDWSHTIFPCIKNIQPQSSIMKCMSIKIRLNY